MCARWGIGCGTCVSRCGSWVGCGGCVGREWEVFGAGPGWRVERDGPGVPSTAMVSAAGGEADGGLPAGVGVVAGVRGGLRGERRSLRRLLGLWVSCGCVVWVSIGWVCSGVRVLRRVGLPAYAFQRERFWLEVG